MPNVPIDQLSDALIELISQRILQDNASSPNFLYNLNAPDKNFVAKLGQQTTLNVYLVGLRHNSKWRQSDPQTVTARDQLTGTLTVEPRPRFIELTYMVTSWAADGNNRAQQEQQLLGWVMQGLGAFPMLPDDLAQKHNLDAGNWGIQIDYLVEREQPQRHGDFWTALGASPRPVLEVTVTIPVALRTPQTLGMVRTVDAVVNYATVTA
jgi:hypothetical protein